MAHDAALREKAKELFVINGFGMETICTLMPEVARKTLYNWREEDKWEDERRKRIKRDATRRERIEAKVDQILDELDIKTDPKLILALGRLIYMLKSASTFEFSEDKDKKKDKQELTDETWSKIDERFGL